MRRIIYLLALLYVQNLSAQGQNVALDTLAKLPQELKEVSALVKGKNGSFYMLNDSGNPPIVYQLDALGNIIHKTFITNASNIDWEDATLAPNGILYIGDFGNNRNDRQDLKIYMVFEADVLAKDTVRAEVISFTYQDQNAFPPKAAYRNYDMEAMVFYQNKLLLFSKNRTEPFTGYTYVYSLPSHSGTFVAEKVDSIKMGDGPRELFQITSADLSPDGNSLILLSYDKFFIMFDFPYNDVAGGRLVRYDFAQLSQKESVAWIGDSTAFVCDEKSVLGGGNLYALNLASAVKENGLVRKQEVSIPIKEFRDSLKLSFTTELRGKVYYEFFDGEGRRINYGNFGYFDRGTHNVVLTPGEFPNGAYMLNIQIGKRPHAFFVYRYSEVDWNKVKKSLEDRQRELEKSK